VAKYPNAHCLREAAASYEALPSDVMQINIAFSSLQSSQNHLPRLTVLLMKQYSTAPHTQTISQHTNSVTDTVSLKQQQHPERTCMRCACVAFGGRLIIIASGGALLGSLPTGTANTLATAHKLPHNSTNRNGVTAGSVHAAAPACAAPALRGRFTLIAGGGAVLGSLPTVIALHYAINSAHEVPGWFTQNNSATPYGGANTASSTKTTAHNAHLHALRLSCVRWQVDAHRWRWRLAG
jgi:hypothetical protein